MCITDLFIIKLDSFAYIFTFGRLKGRKHDPYTADSLRLYISNDQGEEKIISLWISRANTQPF